MPRLFVAVFLLWQLLFPLWQLSHGSDRFDWAMFRQPRALPIVETRAMDGTISAADVNAWLGYGRGDIRISRKYWRQFCRLAPGAEAVRLTPWPGPPAGEWQPCR